MMTFLLASENLPFTVALAVMLVIAAMEGTALVLGVGFTNLLDKLVPSIDFDLDTPEFSNTTGFTRFLSWLRIGEVPMLITLIIFLTAFGLSGLILQSVVENVLGTLLPAVVAAAAAFLVTLPILRVSHRVVAKVIPKDETYAVSEQSFIGRIALVTGGTATVKKGAQARLRDEFGREHYVLVKPDNDNDTFPPKSSVLLVAKRGAFFYVIQNPNPNLVDKSS